MPGPINDLVRAAWARLPKDAPALYNILDGDIWLALPGAFRLSRQQYCRLSLYWTTAAIFGNVGRQHNNERKSRNQDVS